VVRLTDTIHRIVLPRGDQSNIAVQTGPDGVLLVGSGFSRRATEKLRGAIAPLNGGPIRIIVNAYLHPDHIAGNAIGGEAIPIIDISNLEEMADAGIIGRASDLLADTTYTLRLNGEEIRLIPYPGIHAREDMLVDFNRSGIVHMGDLLIAQSFPSVRQETEADLALLEKVPGMFPDPTTFICGHGPECRREEIERCRAMLAV